jgi:transposase
MTPRKPNPGRLPPPPAEPLRVVNPDAAGIDVHSDQYGLAVPPDRDAEPIRIFGAFTCDLEAIADWLGRCHVTTVVMESTGVYWIPLFELLERRGLRVLLIDPRQAQRASGRPKTDRYDCQWLQRLHAYGLLAGAFRPDDQVCVLRSFLRQRQMLITYAGQHIQHMQKALEQMNVKLAEVVSDITGKTGMQILKAIVGGQRDPHRLAQFRDRHCKHDEATIAKALQGNWREDHRFELQQAIELYEFYHAKLAACDRQLETHLGTFADQRDGLALPTKPRQRARKAHEPHFDARGLLHRMSGVDLTAIEGIDATTAWTILSEIGLDLSRFPSLKHFCSWLGLCPQHKISAGKIKSRHVRPGANRVAQALRLAARSLHHAKTALGGFFRRMKSRMGTAQAITATAHKLARLGYTLLKHGMEYVQQGLQEYEARYRDREVRNVARKARELGFELVPATTC